MPLYRKCRYGDLSVTEKLGRKELNLPSLVGPKKEDIQKVCEVMKRK